MEFSIKTFWRPVKNSPLTFEALNLFSEQLIETGYKIKSENEKRALSLLEEKYKVISVNSICWLVKDVYKFSNLKYRIYQAVLNDKTALNIEFTRWTNPPFGSSELGDCDMIENWNQAEKAFMENFEIELTEEFLSFQKEFWQTYEGKIYEGFDEVVIGVKAGETPPPRLPL
ncbi:hypothetical protein [Aliikangiella maris]|uniref:Uncharacterized protein n=1 Tax=Aliikangiella maris TaxID=3162458 RepID=A0ABV3MTJ7_9GAMM